MDRIDCLIVGDPSAEFLWDRKSKQTQSFLRPVNVLGFYVTIQFKDASIFGEITDASRFNACDVVVLVFNISDPGSFAFARSKYAPLVRQYWTNKPFIVVGTDAEKTINPVMRYDLQPIPREVGLSFASEIGALAYFEYSRETGLNSQPILDTIALSPQPRWLLRFAASFLRQGLPLRHADAKTEAVFEIWNLILRGRDGGNNEARSAPAAVLSSSPRALVEGPLSAPESAAGFAANPSSNTYSFDGARFVAEVDMNQLHYRDDLPDFFSKLTYTKVLRLAKNGLLEQNITPVFDMHALTSLDLSGNVLKSVPSGFTRLVSLTSLDLSDNEIEYIPRELALSCPNLKKLDLAENNLRALPFSLGLLADTLKEFDARSNPLESIPTDKAKRRPTAILAYLKKQQIGQTRPWRRIRTFIVGQQGVGKSTLLRHVLKLAAGSLKDQHNLSDMISELSYKPGSDSKNPVANNGGVDLQTFEMRMTVKGAPKRKVEFRVFDLAGEEAFYPQHQFFLGPKSVYMAVFSLLEPDLGRLEYWLRTIRLVGRTETALKPSVILVGTHLDAIEKNPSISDPTGFLQTMSARIIKKFSNTVALRNIVFVSNKSKKGIDELRAALQERAEKELSQHDSVSPAVVAMDRVLSALKADRKYLAWAEYSQIALQFDILDDQQLVNVTQSLAEAGTVVWFNQPSLRELVFLDLVWLSQIMSVVVRSNSTSPTFHPQPSSAKEKQEDTALTIRELMDRGELPHSRLDELWRDYPPHLHRTLLQLLHHFEIAFPLKGTEKSLVPSLLPATRPAEFASERKRVFGENADNLLQLERLYKFRFVPLGFFPRVIVRTLHIPQTTLVSGWQNGVLIRMNNNQTGLLEWDPKDHKLSVVVVQPSNRDLLFPHLLQQIDSLIKTFYQSARVERLVISHQVSALQQNTFKYEEVLAAFQQGSRTFYCGAIPVPLEDLAPDICLNYIPELKDVTVERKLGAGGFGIVYKGYFDGKPVAIKELHVKAASSTQSEESIERFRAFVHEVWIMSKLNHPNLVRLYGITQQPLRMVMEYCPGLDLYSYLRRDSRLGDREMPADQLRKFQLRIAIDIARGMSYLHGLRPPIVHRDLRSPNVFIMSTDSGAEVVAKIGDFGLSEAASHQFNDFLSTWAWLAPETFNPGETVKYTEKCDLYSFGIVLYEIYSGQDPFGEYFADPRFVQSIERQVLTPEELENEEQLRKWRSLGWTVRPEDNMLLEKSWNVHRIKDAIIKEGLRPSIPPTVPRVIKEIMLRCWLSDPDQRPQFGELLRLLLLEADREGLRLASTAHHTAPLVPPLSLGEEDNATETGDSSIALSSWHASEPRPKNRRAPIVSRRFNSKIGLDTGIMSMVAYPSAGEIWCGCRDGAIRVFNYQHRQKEILFTLKGHSSRVSALALTGSQIWSASDDSKICIWDPVQHRMVNVLGAHSVPVRCLLYIPATEEVWSGDVDGVINMWSSKSHLLVGSLTVPRTGVIIPTSSHSSSAPVPIPVAQSNSFLATTSPSTPLALSLLSAAYSAQQNNAFIGTGASSVPINDAEVPQPSPSSPAQPTASSSASLPPTPVLSMCLVDLRPEDGRASFSLTGSAIGVRRRAASTNIRESSEPIREKDSDDIVFDEVDDARANVTSESSEEEPPARRPSISDMLEIWVGCNSRIVVVSVSKRVITASWEAHNGYRITSIQTVGQHVWTGADIRICIWDKLTKKQLIGEAGQLLERQVEYGVVCMLACRRPNNKYHIWTGSANGSITVWSSNFNKKSKVIFQVLNGHKKDSVHSIVDCGEGTL